MVRVELQIVQVANQIAEKGKKALVNAGGDVMVGSTARTPFKRGQLRSQRRVVPTATGARLEWNAGHAAVQNQGFRAGARPFTRYTTPGTGKDFVKLGLSNFFANYLRWFLK